MVEYTELPKERSSCNIMRTLFFISILCVIPLVACLALTQLTPPAVDHATSPPHLVTMQSVTWSRSGRDVSSTLMVTRPESSNFTWSPTQVTITNHVITNLTTTNSTRLTSSEENSSASAIRTSGSPNAAPSTISVIRNAYFTNDTLLGKPVPCSDAEKECLRFNRILFPADGKCYPLGDGPSRCLLAVDRCEFERRSRHIRGTCAPTDLCRSTPAKQVRLAFDGRCVKLRHLHNFCGRGPVDLVLHFFGDYECSPVVGLTLEKPVYIPQPPESGRCVFPNLRHDLTSVLDQERRLLVKDCSEEQSICFANNKVWYSDRRRCCDLLKQNHCPVGSWVVLDKRSWEAGSVTSTCAPINQCANEHQRLMAFDGQCHNKHEVLRALCPNGVLLPNVFGEMSCVTRDYYKHVIELKSIRPGFCEVSHKLSYDDEIQGVRLTPECGLTGFKNCVDAF